jgi:hypothetical protein
MIRLRSVATPPYPPERAPGFEAKPEAAATAAVTPGSAGSLESPGFLGRFAFSVR